MSKVTAFEAKTRFGELLDRVSRGEEVVITRHDKAVARLVPEGAPRLDEVRRAVSGLRDLQDRIRRRSRAKLSLREVRSAIEGSALTRAFVADASVAIGWVHPAQATPQTDSMLEAIADGATVEVPALWPLEVANALTVLRRRRKLTEDERQEGLGWLRRLPLRLDHEMALLAFSRLSELASAHELSVYDAAYLELAQRKRLALGCQDGSLRKAARQAGIALWE